MPINFSQVVDIQISLICSVILPKNCSDLFLCLREVRLGTHGFHELVKTDAPGFLNIKLGYDLIHSFFIGTKTVLSQ